MTPDWAARPTSVPYAVFGDPQSLNLYVYVRNDPISRNDPDGHCMAHGEGDHCGPGSLADGFKMSLRQSEITAQGSETATPPEGEAQNKPQTIDQVAMSAETAAIKPTRDSVKNGDYHEYGGLILQRDKSGNLSATKPIAGKERSVDLDSILVPKGYTVVGEYHTHPHGTADEGQGPSPQDIGRLRQLGDGRTGYVVDSYSGVVFRYTGREPVKGPFDTNVYGTKIGVIP